MDHAHERAQSSTQDTHPQKVSGEVGRSNPVSSDRALPQTSRTLFLSSNYKIDDQTDERQKKDQNDPKRFLSGGSPALNDIDNGPDIQNQ